MSRRLQFGRPQKNEQQRVESVLNFKPTYACEQDYNGLKVKGFVSSPHQTVGSSKQIWVFVQGRWVQDRGLKTAVMEAYRSLLMHGEYPQAVVSLVMDPTEVDVNIHPTKSQVKFRDSSTAFRAVLHTIRDELEKAPWVSDLVKSPPRKEVAPEASVQAKLSHEPSLKFNGPEFSKTQYHVQTPLSAEPAYGQTEATAFFSSQSTEVGRDSQYPPTAQQEDEGRPAKRGQWSQLQIVGQIDQTYLVAQSDRALVLIDQHAAHERVNYESLMSAWSEGGLEVQNYLLPPVFTFDEEIVAALIQYQQEWTKVGLELDAAGPDSISVRSAPAIIKESSLQNTLQVMGEEVLDLGNSFALEKCLNHIASTMACHSSIRAGQALNRDQMVNLLHEMDRFPLSSFCPHGRPVFVEYPFTKIEKDFGRLV